MCCMWWRGGGWVGGERGSRGRAGRQDEDKGGGRGEFLRINQNASVQYSYNYMKVKIDSHQIRTGKKITSPPKFEQKVD